MKMRSAKFKGDVWPKLFTQGVMGVCNTLQGVMVEVDKLVLFKRFLDRHLDMQEIKRKVCWQMRLDNLGKDVVG